MYINNLRTPRVSNSENCFQAPGCMQIVTLQAIAYVFYVSFSVTKELIICDAKKA
ncbi:MAG TPA: hypothetical protein VHP38_07770 [Ruminiclostridium sp.]|nr:hypothetical protein [Ruminiclostridium sp.]